MSKRILYRCDICRDDQTRDVIVGVCFSGMKTFKLAGPDSTDGVHICTGCLFQLGEQIGPYLKSKDQP